MTGPHFAPPASHRRRRRPQPDRYDLVERIEELIAEYNAGILNIDEYLRRLVGLSKSLIDEEQRVVAEGLAEEELAIFDLLTKPDPVLTDAERDVVKASAKRRLGHLHDRLVLDWRGRRPPPPTSERRSAGSSTPIFPPTHTHLRYSTPRSKPCSTTSPPPMATTGHSVYDGTVVTPPGPAAAWALSTALLQVR